MAFTKEKDEVVQNRTNYVNMRKSVVIEHVKNTRVFQFGETIRTRFAISYILSALRHAGFLPISLTILLFGALKPALRRCLSAIR